MTRQEDLTLETTYSSHTASTDQVIGTGMSICGDGAFFESISNDPDQPNIVSVVGVSVLSDLIFRIHSRTSMV